MSRVGRLPVTIPDGVTVEVSAAAVAVKGPKGTSSVPVPEKVAVEQSDGQLVVSRVGEDRKERSLHGLTRKLLENAVVGVSAGFSRTLEISGVGYRADLKGDIIHFNLGYSHPILYQLPDGVTAKIDKQTTVTLEGPDRQVLGQAAAQIRKLRPPEPYKGKGIKYAEETIRRKSGKAAGAA
ncbi:MAG: 50S ribosomal protein L6 [Candidatus Binatia bacterium]|nr:50S ribosomal protein L6 [Candidatus Binatia bacterium]